MINVQNLVFEYPTQRALDGVSFTVAEGSITALVGPNGAGKTTLLKCLAGLVKPFSGHIYINGVDVIKDPRECHRFTGYLADFFGLYDNLTVNQALTYFSLCYEIPEIDIAPTVIQTVEKLNLSDKIHEKIGSLSRGMRQRVGMGQAMIHSPSLLLLDEPASGLDPEARHSLSELFHELHTGGATIIVSSHILAELEDYMTDLIVLRGGKVVEGLLDETPSTAYRQLALKLVSVPEGFVETLGSVEHVSGVQIEGAEVSFSFTGGKEAQAELLKNLIAQGIGVREFYERKVNIQDRYMELVKK